MKTLRKIALGFAALVFLTRLWMQSWLGLSEEKTVLIVSWRHPA